MILLCKKLCVDVYILYEGLYICGWIDDEHWLGFWTWFVVINHDYGVLDVEKNVYQGFDVNWWRNGLDSLVYVIKGWLCGC